MSNIPTCKLKQENSKNMRFIYNNEVADIETKYGCLGKEEVRTGRKQGGGDEPKMTIEDMGDVNSKRKTIGHNSETCHSKIVH